VTECDLDSGGAISLIICCRRRGTLWLICLLIVLAGAISSSLRAHVYRLLRNALEAGNVFVRDSTQFRRFEDELISDEHWKDKDAVLRETSCNETS
jgi:hypothetical protein